MQLSESVPVQYFWFDYHFCVRQDLNYTDIGMIWSNIGKIPTVLFKEKFYFQRIYFNIFTYNFLSGENAKDTSDKAHTIRLLHLKYILKVLLKIWFEDLKNLWRIENLLIYSNLYKKYPKNFAFLIVRILESPVKVCIFLKK